MKNCDVSGAGISYYFCQYIMYAYCSNNVSSFFEKVIVTTVGFLYRHPIKQIWILRSL